MRQTARRVFRNRMEAGLLLAEELKERSMTSPLVLAIPRGGVVTGYALAQELNAGLDVVLSRKLRAPTQPEFAIGAISEDGRVALNAGADAEVAASYLTQEKKYQTAEIERRKGLFREVRPPAVIAGRTVLVTDDGIATGSTMIAALQTVRAQNPYELIAAVPVASPGSLDAIHKFCDEVVCLLAPHDFYAVGQYYDEFDAVEDEEVVNLLQLARTLASTGT